MTTLEYNVGVSEYRYKLQKYKHALVAVFLTCICCIDTCCPCCICCMEDCWYCCWGGAFSINIFFETSLEQITVAFKIKNSTPHHTVTAPSHLLGG